MMHEVEAALKLAEDNSGIRCPLSSDVCGDHFEQIRDLLRKVVSKDMTQGKVTVETSVEFLEAVLFEMEVMWERIDMEWGPTNGGLEKAVADGKEPLIAELRRLTAGVESENKNAD